MEKVVQVPRTTSQTAPPVVQNNMPVMNPFPTRRKKKMNEKFFITGLFVVVLLLGVGTGRILAGSSTNSQSSNLPATAPKVEQQSGGEAGISDESIFKDSEEGVLEKGGIEGEGTHHLVRPGGPTKYIYLTSTVLDLESFVGKKVRIWGQTIAGKKAGWLMDVGKVKIVQ